MMNLHTPSDAARQWRRAGTTRNTKGMVDAVDHVIDAMDRVIALAASAQDIRRERRPVVPGALSSRRQGFDSLAKTTL